MENGTQLRKMNIPNKAVTFYAKLALSYAKTMQVIIKKQKKKTKQMHAERQIQKNVHLRTSCM